MFKNHRKLASITQLNTSKHSFYSNLPPKRKKIKKRHLQIQLNCLIYPSSTNKTHKFPGNTTPKEKDSSKKEKRDREREREREMFAVASVQRSPGSAGEYRY